VQELVDDMVSAHSGRTCRRGGNGEGGWGMISMCCCILCDESGRCCWCSDEVT
jgi:hypothetical protein